MWELNQFGKNIALRDEFNNFMTYEQLETESKIIRNEIGKRALVFCLCKNEIGSSIHPKFINIELTGPLLFNKLRTANNEINVGNAIVKINTVLNTFLPLLGAKA